MHISSEAENLERVLKIAGIPLVAVLADASVDRSTWSRWKSDKTSPRMKNWQAVVDSAAKLTAASSPLINNGISGAVGINAPNIPAPGDTVDRALASSADPISEIQQSQSAGVHQAGAASLRLTTSDSPA